MSDSARTTSDTTANETPKARTGSGPATASAELAKPAGELRPKGLRWWREIGWRHVVGAVAIVWAVFPILYIV
jgi:arabinogalactan oligomer/maltooligosaccharide transport system permease protein